MFSQERRTIAFVIALVIILTSISVSTSSVSLPILRRDTFQMSSEVWSDDFENVSETLTDWIIDGTQPPNVTLSNGLLYSNGPGRNVITHNSTTAIGTWSFDMFLEESDHYDYTAIYFMTPYWEPDYSDQQGYVFIIRSSAGLHYFVLGYDLPFSRGGGIRQLDEDQFVAATGWRHIDITRQSDHNMYVFLNGTLLLQGTDTDLSTSEYFRLVSYEYVVFDNITVSDTVDLDGVAPHWTEPLIDHMINQNVDFIHPLFADDYSGIDTWWVNDSSNFAVDDDGVVTSVGLLPAGNYDLEVYVNDTFGNVLTGTFRVRVRPWPPPIPTTTDTTTTSSTNTEPIPLNPLTITMFGAAGVAWSAAIIFIFRDYRNRRNT